MGRPYLKAAYKKAREGLFTRACSDRTRGNDFKLKESRFRLDRRKKFCTMRVVRHRNTGTLWKCSRPGWMGFEQPGLEEGVLAHGRGVGTR